MILLHLSSVTFMDIEEGATDITGEEATFEGETAGDKNGLIVGVGDRDENRS